MGAKGVHNHALCILDWMRGSSRKQHLNIPITQYGFQAVRNERTPLA